MPRIPDDYKQARLDRVLNYLAQHTNGLTEQEISRALNVQRRTLNNYLNELEAQGRLWRDGRLWLPAPHDRAHLQRFELSPEQAVTLYLATRLLVKQNDKRNEVAETVLMRLATILAGDAGVDQAIEQAALELAQRPGDDTYSQIFKAISRGYVYRRWVRVTYQPRKQRPFETTLAPYLLEPSAVGFTTYVIGYSTLVDDIRTYKLERIQQATLTGDDFSVPPDFPGLELLGNAWSIIHGDELIEVVLRFHPSVADRVLETRWHPSQETRPDPENAGYLLWSAKIADLTDFLPWVRGWGADVEVLAPDDLRNTLQGEAHRLAELYGWQASQTAADDDVAATFADFFGD